MKKTCHMRLWSVVGLCALSIIACVPSTDLAGKKCPCGDSAYRCCESLGQCILKTETCPEICEPFDSCIVYVNGQATPGSVADGASWETAFGTVQAGIDAAALTECEVWVAKGTYVPTQTVLFDSDVDDPRAKSIRLSKGVSLYGGFEGSQENPCQRDIDQHETILSGDLLQNDLASMKKREDNAYHVIVAESNTRLDGFTVSGGNGNHPDDTQFDTGAGLVLPGSVSVNISNCTFKANNARMGGGIHAQHNSDYTISGSKFVGNETTWSGGAIYNNGISTILNCEFIDNAAGKYDGGAVYNSVDTHVTIFSSLFWKNSAGRHGGGIRHHQSHASIVNCTFYDNDARNGGGLFNEGDAVKVYNTIIWENTAVEYPALFDYSNDTVVKYSLLGDTFWESDSASGIMDPDFVDAPAGDFRLEDDSACIDKGLNTLLPEDFANVDTIDDLEDILSVDLMNNDRIIHGRVDLGAIEHPIE